MIRPNRQRFGALALVVFSMTAGAQTIAQSESNLDLTQRYLLLATTKTSTLQTELDEAAAAAKAGLHDLSELGAPDCHVAKE